MPRVGQSKLFGVLGKSSKNIFLLHTGLASDIGSLGDGKLVVVVFNEECGIFSFVHLLQGICRIHTAHGAANQNMPRQMEELSKGRKKISNLLVWLHSFISFLFL